jgi:hypothetical protein
MLQKKIKIKKFGRKCQHSPQFFSKTKAYKKITDKKYLLKFQPIMVLQSTPPKKKIKVENFGRKCQHSSNFFFQKIKNKKYRISL